MGAKAVSGICTETGTVGGACGWANSPSSVKDTMNRITDPMGNIMNELAGLHENLHWMKTQSCDESIARAADSAGPKQGEMSWKQSQALKDCAISMGQEKAMEWIAEKTLGKMFQGAMAKNLAA